MMSTDRQAFDALVPSDYPSEATLTPLPPDYSNSAQAFAAREAIEAGLWDRHLTSLAMSIRQRMRTSAWLAATSVARAEAIEETKRSTRPGTGSLR